MNITDRMVGAVTILDNEGPTTLGAAAADRFGDKVRSLLQQGQKGLVVNLARVPYMDSAGLGELVQAYMTALRQGGRLTLIGVTTRLNDLLVITKLATVFESFDSESAAVASFAAAVQYLHARWCRFCCAFDPGRLRIADREEDRMAAKRSRKKDESTNGSMVANAAEVMGKAVGTAVSAIESAVGMRGRGPNGYTKMRSRGVEPSMATDRPARRRSSPKKTARTAKSQARTRSSSAKSRKNR